MKKEKIMIERYQTEEMKSIFNDQKKFEYLLLVEKAAASAQAELGLIPKKAALSIERKSKLNIQKIFQIEKQTKHDVIAFIQQVSHSIGINGRYFHYGLTSSDVLDTALSLQIADAFKILLIEINQTKKIIYRLAQKHKSTLCAGRTHGIFAEITTFGFKMMGYLSEIDRAHNRMLSADQQFKRCKLSGAVGTSSALGIKTEALVAKKLKLKVEPFATQVIPRDRHAEVLTSLAFLASALERLAIELRHLQRTEVSEVIEDFSLRQKGSSAMPHKKNPISAENITGLCRLIKGYSQISFDNIPLWHERDISHSSNERVIFQDSFTATHFCLKRMNRLLEGLFIDVEQMKKNTYLGKGRLYSSLVLNQLVQKGWTREKAYDWLQGISFKMDETQNLKDILIQSQEIKSLFTKKEIEDLFSAQQSLKSIHARIKIYEKKIK